MRRNICIAVVVLMLVLFVSFVLADGMMFVPEATWRTHKWEAMNEPDQKAVVFYSKGREQLIISPSFEGPGGNFAWVVPVPSKPKVEILKGSLFHELASLLEYDRPMYYSFDGHARSKNATNAAPVTVIEQKTVGAYDVSVLSATDGSALMKWLEKNKYHLPSKALAPIKGYVKDGWTFVACKVTSPSTSKGLKTGSLAPIHLTFSAKRPVYPVRLSSANPEPFGMLVYLILPTSELGKHPSEAVKRDAPKLDGWPSKTIWLKQVKAGPDHFPTLAKLSREELQIYKLSAPKKLQSKDCTKDVRWSINKK